MVAVSTKCKDRFRTFSKMHDFKIFAFPVPFHVKADKRQFYHDEEIRRRRNEDGIWLIFLSCRLFFFSWRIPAAESCETLGRAAVHRRRLRAGRLEGGRDASCAPGAASNWPGAQESRGLHEGCLQEKRSGID